MPPPRNECMIVTLSDEEKLTILRKWPSLIVNDSLKLVNVVADFLEERSHCVVVSDCLLALALNLVSCLACFNHLLYVLDDE